MSEIQICAAGDLSNRQWGALYDLYRAALEHDASHMDPGVLAAMQETVDMGVVNFTQAHVFPNERVGRTLRSGQDFTNPRVAYCDGGFMYGADNVSGRWPAERSIKRLLGRSYLWCEQIVVAPDERRNHLGLRMAQLLVATARPGQALTAYPYKASVDIRNTLLRYGLRETMNPEEIAQLAPADYVRMQGDSGVVEQRIEDALQKRA